MLTFPKPTKMQEARPKVTQKQEKFPFAFAVTFITYIKKNKAKQEKKQFTKTHLQDDFTGKLLLALLTSYWITPQRTVKYQCGRPGDRQKEHRLFKCKTV